MILAPSVLSLDYGEFQEQLDILNREVKWLHFDVMDGHFVPNLSFGPDILRTFRTRSSLFMDVHLMIDNPFFYSEAFLKAGADQITFHYEALENLESCENLIDKIHNMHIKAGISIKPMTSVETIEPLLEKVDTVLVMSVEPGFGGQAFLPSALDKIAYLKKYRKEHKLSYLIEVDGGINEKTAHDAVKKGCDVIVAGSYIFKGDIENNINTLKNI